VPVRDTPRALLLLLHRANHRASRVAGGLWRAGRKFREDDGLLLAGALAFFGALSLAPLLLVVVGAASLVVDEGPVRAMVLEKAEEVLGGEGRIVALTVLDHFEGPNGGLLSIAIGVVGLLIGATSGFAHLRTALNRVFSVREGPRNGLVRKRLLSLFMVLALGVLILASIVLTTAVSIAHRWVDHQAGFDEVHPWADLPWHTLDWITSLVVITALVMAVFKLLPDVRLAWRDVFIGAAVTTALFTAGKSAAGLYFGTKSAVSAYGAAGSFVVVLLWLYYSAVVLLYGAELTQVLVSRASGRGAPPRRGAKAFPAPWGAGATPGRA
jgi:membrane protein